MIIRIVFFIVLSFASFVLLNAQNYLFSIGPVYSPFAYQNFNKSDWNNYPDSYPVGKGQLNGSSIGLRFQVPISDKFILKSGLTYSKQKQQHKSYTIILQSGGSSEIEFVYNSTIENRFNIISIPIHLSFNQEIGYKSGFYLSIYGGPQISFLTKYESTYSAYAYDASQDRILYDSITNYIYQSQDNAYQRIISGNSPEYVEHPFNLEDQYNKVLFGVSGGIEFQKFIGDNFLLGLGAFSDYDFTNSETSTFYIYPSLAGLNNHQTRSKSHNIRIGLTLTAQYIFY
jgi:hypothetical protein